MMSLRSWIKRILAAGEFKTHFSPSINHTWRTPLTLVTGSTERILAAPDVTREQRYNLEMIDRNVPLLLQRMNELLDVVRLAAGSIAEFANSCV